MPESDPLAPPDLLRPKGARQAVQFDGTMVSVLRMQVLIGHQVLIEDGQAVVEYNVQAHGAAATGVTLTGGAVEALSVECANHHGGMPVGDWLVKVTPRRFVVLDADLVDQVFAVPLDAPAHMHSEVDAISESHAGCTRVGWRCLDCRQDHPDPKPSVCDRCTGTFLEPTWRYR